MNESEKIKRAFMVGASLGYGNLSPDQFEYEAELYLKRLAEVNPSWLDNAKSYLGLKEVKGTKHNPKILTWWTKIRAPFSDDETPWCAAFVGGVLEECGIKSTRSAMARSYLKFGVELIEPAVGCIVVFWRGSLKSASGHVGFVVGKTNNGEIVVLGGNQEDSVSLAKFNVNRILSFRWPNEEIQPSVKGFSNLPTICLNSKLSDNEQ